MKELSSKFSGRGRRSLGELILDHSNDLVEPESADQLQPHGHQLLSRGKQNQYWGYKLNSYEGGHRMAL